LVPVNPSPTPTTITQFFSTDVQDHHSIERCSGCGVRAAEKGCGTIAVGANLTARLNGITPARFAGLLFGMAAVREQPRAAQRLLRQRRRRGEDTALNRVARSAQYGTVVVDSFVHFAVCLAPARFAVLIRGHFEGAHI